MRNRVKKNATVNPDERLSHGATLRRQVLILAPLLLAACFSTSVWASPGAFAGEHFIEPASQDRPARWAELSGQTEDDSWAPGESRQMQVSPHLLEAGKMHLRLPDGEELKAVTTASESPAAGERNWHGHLLDRDGERVGTGVFTAVGDRVVGQFSTREGRHRLRPDGRGGHELSWIDPDVLPEKACQVKDTPHTHGFSLSPAEAESLQSAAADAAAVVDVLVLYTPQAEADLGGEESTRLELRNAMAAANAAFAASDVDMRVRMVGLHAWDHVESGSDDLYAMRNDTDISALRDRYAADLVALVGNYGDEFCGVAWLMQNYDTDFESHAYSLTSSAFDGACLANQTLAHEMGHNMGLHHDPGNAPSPGELIEPFALGHFEDGEFRTVMSYWSQCPGGQSSNCPLIDHFSNPQVPEPGFSRLPTGLKDTRDNARVLRKSSPIAEQFRVPDVSLSDGLGTGDPDWKSGGASVWLGDEDGQNTHAWSGEVMGGESVWFERLHNAKTVEFEWKIIGDDKDEASLLLLEDNEIRKTLEQPDDWQPASFNIDENQSLLRWSLQADDGIGFGGVEARVRNVEYPDTERYAGQVRNTIGQPLSAVEISEDGDPVGRSRDNGAFNFRLGDEITGVDLDFGGTRLHTESRALSDCQSDSPCEVILDGEEVTLEVHIQGLLADEEFNVLAGYKDEQDEFSEVTSKTVSTRDNGNGEFELELNAAIDHAALRLDAFGYEDTELALPRSRALRDNELDMLMGAMVPRVPELKSAEETGDNWRGFTVNADVATNERDTELVLSWGEAGEALDNDTSRNLSAKESSESRNLSVGGLECGTNYQWRLEAVSDHGDSSNILSGTTTTRSCDGAFGCSASAAPGARPDPLLPLLALLALAGLLARRAH